MDLQWATKLFQCDINLEWLVDTGRTIDARPSNYRPHRKPSSRAFQTYVHVLCNSFYMRRYILIIMRYSLEQFCCWFNIQWATKLFQCYIHLEWLVNTGRTIDARSSNYRPHRKPLSRAFQAYVHVLCNSFYMRRYTPIIMRYSLEQFCCWYLWLYFQ